METLVIYRSSNRDGATYALPNRSRNLIQERFGRTLSIRSRIFIAHAPDEDPKELDALPTASREALVTMITTLKPDEASAFQIEFRDPVTEPE